MSKPTLLELTQDILSSMDSDEVNSITDTTESQQVATIIKTVYRDIVNRGNMPDQFILFGLEPSGDSGKPTLMSLPSDIEEMLWLKYDRHITGDTTALRFEMVRPMSLEEFLNLTLGQNTSNTNIFTFTHTLSTSGINPHTMTFMGRNDKAPEWYTSFDDGTIVFDSYDSVLDVTLQKSKTMGYGQKAIPWANSDSFVPVLDEKQFSLLFNEAKALCFAELKQTSNMKAEQAAKRQWVNLQSSKTKVPLQTELDKLPNYGRNRR